MSNFPTDPKDLREILLNQPTNPKSFLEARKQMEEASEEVASALAAATHLIESLEILVRTDTREGTDGVENFKKILAVMAASEAWSQHDDVDFFAPVLALLAEIQPVISMIWKTIESEGIEEEFQQENKRVLDLYHNELLKSQPPEVQGMSEVMEALAQFLKDSEEDA